MVYFLFFPLSTTQLTWLWSTVRIFFLILPYGSFQDRTPELETGPSRIFFKFGVLLDPREKVSLAKSFWPMTIISQDIDLQKLAKIGVSPMFRVNSKYLLSYQNCWKSDHVSKMVPSIWICVKTFWKFQIAKNFGQNGPFLAQISSNPYKILSKNLFKLRVILN